MNRAIGENGYFHKKLEKHFILLNDYNRLQRQPMAVSALIL
jgi:hypothetical protein